MTTRQGHAPTAVRLQRVIPAPPERVYRAWLDPEVMMRWFCPKTFTVGRAEVDERIGGRLAVWHEDGDGTDLGGAECEILELVPDKRIVLDWQFVGPNRATDPAMSTRLTITLAPDPGGTRLELVHDRLGALREYSPEVFGGVNEGWNSALENLAAAGV